MTIMINGDAALDKFVADIDTYEALEEVAELDRVELRARADELLDGLSDEGLLEVVVAATIASIREKTPPCA
jgi:hypothetical protein